MSTTTPNHLAHSRAQLAEASELADAGSTALARIRLLAAADHALIALAAHRAVDVPPGQPGARSPRDRRCSSPSSAPLRTTPHRSCATSTTTAPT